MAFIYRLRTSVIAQAPTAAKSLQVDSATGIVTVSYEPQTGGRREPQQEAGCSGCRQTRDSYRAAIIGASSGGLVLLLVVAGGDPSMHLISHAVSFICLMVKTYVRQTIEPSYLPRSSRECVTTVTYANQRIPAPNLGPTPKPISVNSEERYVTCRPYPLRNLLPSWPERGSHSAAMAGLAVRRHRRSVDPEVLYAAEARKVALQQARSCSGCGDVVDHAMRLSQAQVRRCAHPSRHHLRL